MRQRVPDIYIIGAQKSGTTSLFDWLSQHPEIYAHPLAKDFGYFGNNETHREGSKQFYAFSKRANDNQLILGAEASAMYAKLGAQRMKEVIPEAKLVAILRNPIFRAYSAYCYAVECLRENRTLEEAISDELSGIKYSPGDGVHRDYLAHGHYAQQLEQIYRFFDRSQVKVIIFEQLKNNPSQIMEELFQFINVKSFTPNMLIKNRTQGGYKSKLLANLLKGPPSSKVLRNTVRKVTPFSFRIYIRKKLKAINRKEYPKPLFDDSIREILYEYYQDEIYSLEKNIKVSIPEWEIGCRPLTTHHFSLKKIEVDIESGSNRGNIMTL